jgi:hypothetical protein
MRKLMVTTFVDGRRLLRVLVSEAYIPRLPGQLGLGRIIGDLSV